MVFHFSDDDKPKIHGQIGEVLQAFKQSSLNIAVDADLVPRLPGNVTYAKAALKSCAENILQKYGVESQVKNLLKDSKDLLATKFDMESTAEELGKFKHLSNLLITWVIGEDGQGPFKMLAEPGFVDGEDFQ
ncbi:unnamed protein product, partial [Effrenium voratum]